MIIMINLIIGCTKHYEDREGVPGEDREVHGKCMGRAYRPLARWERCETRPDPCRAVLGPALYGWKRGVVSGKSGPQYASNALTKGGIRTSNERGSWSTTPILQ